MDSRIESRTELLIDTELRYRGIRVSISPRIPTFLGCMPQEFSSSVGSDIEFNIIWLSHETSQVLFASVDALYAGPRLRRVFELALGDSLLDSEIFLSATHTHNAPNLDPTKPSMAPITEEHLSHVIATVYEGLAKLREQPWDLVSFTLTTGALNGVQTRRKKLPELFRFLTKSDSTVFQLPAGSPSPQPTSFVVTFFDKSGAVKGFISSVACHPVSYPDALEPSADYIGRLRFLARGLSAASSAPFVFIQGASGDINPSSASYPPKPSLRQLIFHGFFGPPFARFTRSQYDAWVEDRFRELWLEGERSECKSIPSITAYRHLEPLNDWFKSSGESSSDRKMSFHGVRIGDLTILGCSAEPTWEYWQLLRDQHNLDPTRWFLVGCIDDTYGYLPSPRQLSEGGYEARGHFEAFELIETSPFQYFISHGLSVFSNMIREFGREPHEGEKG